MSGKRVRKGLFLNLIWRFGGDGDGDGGDDAVRAAKKGLFLRKITGECESGGNNKATVVRSARPSPGWD